MCLTRGSEKMSNYDFEFDKIINSKNVYDGLEYLLTRANHIKDIVVINK